MFGKGLTLIPSEKGWSAYWWCLSVEDVQTFSVDGNSDSLIAVGQNVDWVEGTLDLSMEHHRTVRAKEGE